jgi:hypothetical protein
MFRPDESTRRLDWGREGRGWLTVGGQDGPTSTVTIHLETHDESDSAEIEQTLDETLANIEHALSES